MVRSGFGLRFDAFFVADTLAHTLSLAFGEGEQGMIWTGDEPFIDGWMCRSYRTN